MQLLSPEPKIAHYKSIYGDKYAKALKQVEDNINKPLINLFDVGKFSGLTEVLFMERCLRLLKAGGRMGIVLPEGVLNNSNLQKVRDYFAGRAKIVLITSIPQDVFISAKATVKPSLLFLKKFTDNETKQYQDALNASFTEIQAKYHDKLEAITISDITKKEKNKQTKALQTQIEQEAKELTKDKFNYHIPIVEAKQAGINTLGEACDNDLIDVAKEFREYRQDAHLWQNPAAIPKPNYLADGE